jgi:CMP-2-keto-3-deoxyoctulosonic acid synthetase
MGTIRISNLVKFYQFGGILCEMLIAWEECEKTNDKKLVLSVARQDAERALKCLERLQFISAEQRDTCIMVVQEYYKTITNGVMNDDCIYGYYDMLKDATITYMELRRLLFETREDFEELRRFFQGVNIALDRVTHGMIADIS